MAGGRLGESAVALVIFLHQGQEGLVVAHWCCIRLHSLRASVSRVLLHAPAGIESYQGLEPVALEILQHFQIVEGP